METCQPRLNGNDQAAGGDIVMSGQLARCLALLRIAAGACFAVAPRRVGGLLVGQDADRPGAHLFIAAFGARDVLLGAGTLNAAIRQHPVRPWLVSCAAADTFDAAATLARFRDLPRGRRVLTFVVSMIPAVAGGWLASTMDL